MFIVVALDAIDMKCLPSIYVLGLLSTLKVLTLNKMDTILLGKPTGFLRSISKG